MKDWEKAFDLQVTLIDNFPNFMDLKLFSRSRKQPITVASGILTVQWSFWIMICMFVTQCGEQFKNDCFIWRGKNCGGREIPYGDSIY